MSSVKRGYVFVVWSITRKSYPKSNGDAVVYQAATIPLYQAKAPNANHT